MNVGSHWIAIVLAALLCLASGCEKSPLTPIQRAEASYDAGDWQSTIDTTSSILASDPKHEKALYFRGQSYVALEMYREAIADYTTYIEFDPTDPERYYLRKMAYQRAGMEKLAEADGAKGRSMDSQYKSAYIFDPSNFGPKIQLDLNGDKKSDEEDSDNELDESEKTASQVAKQDEPTNDAVAQSETRQTSPADSLNSDSLPNFGGAATNDTVTTVQPAPNVADLPTVDVPTAPAQPEMPGKDALVAGAQSSSDAGLLVPNDGNFHQQWVAEQRALAQEKNQGDSSANDPSIDEPEETVSTGPIRQFTTSLPPTFSNPKSRPTSPNYMPTVPGLGATVEGAGARATGINSSPNAKLPKGPPTTGIKSIPNPALAAGQGKGILPGQFRGNTLYQSGKKVTLSTSIPGTKTVNGTAPTQRKLPSFLNSPPPVIRKGTLSTARSKAKAKLGTQLPTSGAAKSVPK
ncbi:MAG: hypothetical protein AAF497_11740 [Planctomycetota bacterium]